MSQINKTITQITKLKTAVKKLKHQRHNDKLIDIYYQVENIIKFASRK